MADLISQVIAVATAERGKTDGTKYANAFGGGGNWCAYFVCWAFKQAGALVAIPGGASGGCTPLHNHAAAVGRFMKTPMVGDIAIFEFGTGTGGDHTGIVTGLITGGVTCIEGNTTIPGNPKNGVAMKSHTTHILGYIRPYWTDAGHSLTVDGAMGYMTISTLQGYLGTPVDGVISWPSLMVKELQRRLNAAGMTGSDGKALDVDGKGFYQDGKPTHTIWALQTYLKSKGLVTVVDGFLSRGTSTTVKALQKLLNTDTKWL